MRAGAQEKVDQFLATQGSILTKPIDPYVRKGLSVVASGHVCTYLTIRECFKMHCTYVHVYVQCARSFIRMYILKNNLNEIITLKESQITVFGVNYLIQVFFK